jgi:O-antigen ligase
VSVLAQPRPSAFRIAIWALVPLSAVVLGVATTVSTRAGLAIAVLLAFVAAMVLRPASILALLTVSVYLEVITVSGVTVSRLIAPVALLIVLFQIVRGEAFVRGGPQLFWTFLYVTLAVASAMWTVSTSYTATGIASLAIALTYMLCFAALLDSEAQLRRLLRLLAVASLVVGLWSLASFKGLTFVPGGSLQAGRGQGGVGDPNSFASLQLIAFPLILVLAAEAKERWVRWGLGLTAFVTIASVLATLSRGGLVALVLVVLVLPFLPADALFSSRRQKTLVMLVLAVGVLLLMTRPTFRGEVVSRAKTIFVGGGANGSNQGSGREALWKAARTSIGERPLDGVGYGAFGAVSNDLMRRTPGVDLESLAVHQNGLVAHSTYLGTAAEIGLPGLALFLAVVASTALALRRAANRAKQEGAMFLSHVSNALLLSMLGWAISAIFLETETGRPLWIVIGISLALPKLIAAERAR